MDKEQLLHSLREISDYIDCAEAAIELANNKDTRPIGTVLQGAKIKLSDLMEKFEK